MTFTLFDALSVPQSLHRWEIGEYVSEGFVILGCAGELVADLATCVNRRTRKHIERWSTIVLVLGLSIGLKCLIRTNELSGEVIGSLGDRADEADQKAKTAISDSGTALAQAKDALEKASKAQESLGKAETNAAKAQGVASGARNLATSAENDVKQLQGSLEKAAKDLDDLQARIAWRTISDEQKNGLRDRLQAFRGRTVKVAWVSSESEPNTFAPQLIDALTYAGLTVTAEPMGLAVLQSKEYKALGLLVEGDTHVDFVLALGKALVCTSLTKPRIKMYPSSGDVTIRIRPKDPIPITDAEKKDVDANCQ
jgi:hypothetical protein